MTKKNLINWLQRLSSHPNVVFAYLFGSAAWLEDHEKISEYSDIDIAVFISSNLEQSLVEIQANILAYLPYEYDLVSLTSVSLRLKAQAVKGDLIFTKSEATQTAFENEIQKKMGCYRVGV